MSVLRRLDVGMVLCEHLMSKSSLVLYIGTRIDIGIDFEARAGCAFRCRLCGVLLGLDTWMQSVFYYQMVE